MVQNESVLNRMGCAGTTVLNRSESMKISEPPSFDLLLDWSFARTTKESVASVLSWDDDSPLKIQKAVDALFDRRQAGLDYPLARTAATSACTSDKPILRRAASLDDRFRADFFLMSFLALMSDAAGEYVEHGERAEILGLLRLLASVTPGLETYATITEWRAAPDDDLGRTVLD